MPWEWLNVDDQETAQQGSILKPIVFVSNIHNRDALRIVHHRALLQRASHCDTRGFLDR